MKYLSEIALVCLLTAAAFIAGRSCEQSGHNQPQEFEVENVQLKVDSTPVVLDMEIPEPVVIYRSMPVDTAAVVADYLSTKRYALVHEDSNVRITFNPVIRFNRLDSIPIRYQILRPTEVITYKPLPPNSLSLGGFVGAGWGPMLNYTRNNLTLGAGWDVHNQAVQVGVSYTLISW